MVMKGRKSCSVFPLATYGPAWKIEGCGAKFKEDDYIFWQARRDADEDELLKHAQGNFPASRNSTEFICAGDGNTTPYTGYRILCESCVRKFGVIW